MAGVNNSKSSILCVFVFVLFSSFVADVNAASETCPGHLSARILKPIPDNVIYDLEIFDDAVLNIHFKDQFTIAMERVGHPLKSGAPYIIEFNPEQSTDRKLSISMLIRVRATGNVSWTGNMYCTMKGTNLKNVVDAIIDPLVTGLGRNLTNYPF